MDSPPTPTTTGRQRFRLNKSKESNEPQREASRSGSRSTSGSPRNSFAKRTSVPSFKRATSADAHSSHELSRGSSSPNSFHASPTRSPPLSPPVSPTARPAHLAKMNTVGSSDLRERITREDRRARLAGTTDDTFEKNECIRIIFLLGRHGTVDSSCDE